MNAQQEHDICNPIMYMVPAEQGWVKSKPRVTTVSTFLIQYGTMSLFLVSLDDGGLETLQNRHGQGGVSATRVAPLS
jgi:hypothetical protein